MFTGWSGYSLKHCMPNYPSIIRDSSGEPLSLNMDSQIAASLYYQITGWEINVNLAPILYNMTIDMQVTLSDQSLFFIITHFISEFCSKYPTRENAGCYDVNIVT